LRFHHLPVALGNHGIDILCSFPKLKAKYNCSATEYGNFARHSAFSEDFA